MPRLLLTSIFAAVFALSACGQSVDNRSPDTGLTDETDRQTPAMHNAKRTVINRIGQIPLAPR